MVAGKQRFTLQQAVAANPQVFDQTVMVGTIPFRVREPRTDVKFTVGRSF